MLGGSPEVAEAEVLERINQEHGKVVGSFGASKAVGFEDAKEAIIQLIVDAGEPGQGNRIRLFSRDFKLMGCFCSQDDGKPRTACIYYAGGFEAKAGAEAETDQKVDNEQAQQLDQREQMQEEAPDTDEVQAQLDRFLGEEVAFEMPDGVQSWNDSSTIRVEAGVALKTTRRILKLADGSE